MAATGTPAQQHKQGVVVGNFRLCGTFSFLSVSLLHRLSTPLFRGMWGREVPLQPWAHFWKAPSLAIGAAAHPWRDLPSAWSSQGFTRVPTWLGQWKPKTVSEEKRTSSVATMCAYDFWAFWAVKTSILGVQGEGKGHHTASHFYFYYLLLCLPLPSKPTP